MKVVITKHAQRQFALRKGIIVPKPMTIDAEIVKTHSRRGRFNKAIEMVSNGITFIAIIKPWDVDPSKMAIVTVYHGSSIQDVDTHYHSKQAYAIDSRAKANHRLSLQDLKDIHNEIKEII